MTTSKRYDRIAFVASAGDEAQAALAQLVKLYGNQDADEADVVVADRLRAPRRVADGGRVAGAVICLGLVSAISSMTWIGPRFGLKL